MRHTPTIIHVPPPQAERGSQMPSRFARAQEAHPKLTRIHLDGSHEEVAPDVGDDGSAASPLAVVARVQKEVEAASFTNAKDREEVLNSLANFEYAS